MIFWVWTHHCFRVASQMLIPGLCVLVPRHWRFACMWEASYVRLYIRLNSLSQFLANYSWILVDTCLWSSKFEGDGVAKFWTCEHTYLADSLQSLPRWRPAMNSLDGIVKNEMLLIQMNMMYKKLISIHDSRSQASHQSSLIQLIVKRCWI